MKFDIVFIDIAAMKPYSYNSLENDSLGGTEQSTIRLAEGFASKGHSVSVVQRFDFDPVQSPNGCWYSPASWFRTIDTKNVIHLRARNNLYAFKQSKQFVWFHDAGSPTHNNYSDWPAHMDQYSATGVCVSDWHKTNILSLAPSMNLERIYSPVDELCYTYPRANEFDQNQLVWLSSPHKGLGEALSVFQKLRKIQPEFKLVVFNPGYCFEREPKMLENVRYLNQASKTTLRSVVSKSLCLFYPTVFEETFGLVASETNALGTPVASYGNAALAESSATLPFSSEEELVSGILKWRNEGRPHTTGQDRFRFESVYKDWLKLLNL